MKGISKSYGGVQALQDVDLELYHGELLCLLGENGAGKSTLMKVLSGVIQPTKGDIFINDEKVNITNPNVAHSLGISTVHQELVQFPDMKISENIFMGRYPKKKGIVSFKALRKTTLDLMDKLNIHFDPDAYIRSLSIAQRQLVEIMKAISFNSKIIIFDEPTASLTREETNILFRIIGELKSRGVSIIYISHRMEDIFTIGDRIVVLRDGKNSGSGLVEDLDVDRVIEMMVGRSLDKQFPKEHIEIGEEIFRVENITNEHVKNASFTLKKGEILGFGGLVGAGRTELMRAIIGLDRCTGSIYKYGKKIVNKNPTEAIKNNFAFVPEDRKDHGLILIRNIMHNAELSSLKQFSKLGFMSTNLEKSKTEEYINKLNIKTTGPLQLAGDLSGGNQQKVVLSKCLISIPDILILDEPTRGIDVGSKVEIYEIMNELVKQGVSIIMISSELPELLNMSDRIVVMREGIITGELLASEATETSVMKLATKEAVVV
ncbi:MAG: sugar ABC transporter ATP-binding protein [Tissierellaceae bacterium]|nr:sugar ABC transporter ATP-binding protein [Tissierellaceae bacterium]